MAKEITTLLSMLKEMQTWSTISEEILREAEQSGIDTSNNPKLKRLVQNWVKGYYDEDQPELVSELKSLIK